MAAAWNNRGDFYASLPGTYVKTINLVLWTALTCKARGYHLDTITTGRRT